LKKRLKQELLQANISKKEILSRKYKKTKNGAFLISFFEKR